MAYDVFLVSALEDRDMAKLVARRLRALKFKVWFDQKQTDDTFDQKDARDALNSQSVLVLWSENAVKSDFVRAAASVGHSRPGTLVQIGMDDVVPYDPFAVDKRYMVDGMTSRTTPEGFYNVVEELGRRDGRTDLRQWMGYGNRDESQKAAWLSAHPTDPLALAAQKARERKLGAKPAPAAAAAGAAALAASSLKSSRPGTTATAKAPVASAPTVSTAAATASVPDATGPANANDEPIGIGWNILAPILLGIAAMLFLAWTMRSQAATGATLPAVANASFGAVCPAGSVPRAMLAPRTLESGPVIDDTSED